MPRIACSLCGNVVPLGSLAFVGTKRYCPKCAGRVIGELQNLAKELLRKAPKKEKDEL